MIPQMEFGLLHKLSLPLTTQLRDNCVSLRDSGTLYQIEELSLTMRDHRHVCLKTLSGAKKDDFVQ